MTQNDPTPNIRYSGKQNRFMFLVAFAHVALIARMYLSIFLTSENAKKWSDFGYVTAIVILSAASMYCKEYRRKRITDFALLCHLAYISQYTMLMLYAGIYSFEHAHEASHTVTSASKGR